MLYSHLHIWKENGQIWHAYYRPGTRDLSMGPMRSDRDADRSIAWAKMHGMTILDERNDHQTPLVSWEDVRNSEIRDADGRVVGHAS